jgi:hypothetical protein
MMQPFTSIILATNTADLEKCLTETEVEECCRLQE